MCYFYTAKIVASKIGVSYSTMIAIIRNNEITYSKIGKRKKFSDDDISRYLEKNKSQSK